MSPAGSATLIAAVAMFISALAEWLHARRVRGMERLVFGRPGRPEVWTRGVPLLRIAATVMLAWGLVILAFSEPETAGASAHAESATDNGESAQRVLLVLDVSPSMNAEDAGIDQTQRRRDRVMDVVQGILSRISLTRTRFSVVVFFTSARPVVVDAADTAVVHNVLDNLPLVWSFEPGQTRLVDGLNVAADLARDWPPHSTTMFVCTDGDTVDFSELPQMPRSIRGVEILAVGDSLRSTRVGAHESRQQAAVLKRLALELRGHYYDVNRQHVPSVALRELATTPPAADEQSLSLRALARWFILCGAVILVLLPISLQYFGCRWKPHRELPGRASTYRIDNPLPPVSASESRP